MARKSKKQILKTIFISIGIFTLILLIVHSILSIAQLNEISRSPLYSPPPSNEIKELLENETFYFLSSDNMAIYKSKGVSWKAKKIKSQQPDSVAKNDNAHYYYFILYYEQIPGLKSYNAGMAKKFAEFNLINLKENEYDFCDNQTYFINTISMHKKNTLQFYPEENDIDKRCLVKDRFSFGFGKMEGLNTLYYVQGYDHLTKKRFKLTNLRWFLYRE